MPVVVVGVVVPVPVVGGGHRRGGGAIRALPSGDGLLKVWGQKY